VSDIFFLVFEKQVPTNSTKACGSNLRSRMLSRRSAMGQELCAVRRKKNAFAL